MNKGWKILIQSQQDLKEDEVYWFYNRNTKKGYYHKLLGKHPDNYSIHTDMSRSYPAFKLKSGAYLANKNIFDTFNIYEIQSLEEKNKAKLLLL